MLPLPGDLQTREVVAPDVGQRRESLAAGVAAVVRPFDLGSGALLGHDDCAERGKERYSVTVVDYSGIEQQGIERGKACPPGNQNCRAEAPPALGPGYSHHDERGAIVYATFKLIQRDAKVNYLAWDWQDLVDCGSRAEVAKRGLQRLEGKEYVVQEGDVLNIRFNV